MTSVCLFFKLHRPYILRNYKAKDVDNIHCYEDGDANAASIDHLADECCIPANTIIHNLIVNHKFKISFSISGVMLELFQRYRPDVIRSFQQLAETGAVDFLAETYYHSLSSIYSRTEFQRQVKKQRELIYGLFGIKASVFRNTELVHNNRIAMMAAEPGIKGILCEGVERILRGRCSNQLYSLPGNIPYKLLLRNATLSDDIAFRFGDPNWSEHPLTAGKFADWLHRHPVGTHIINLFMDYETFGIHKKYDSGIFEFLQHLPRAVLSNESFQFATAPEAIDRYSPQDIYDVTNTISWEDKSNMNCVWCENVRQNNTLKKIYSLEKLVSHADEQDLNTWGRLQAADYFYYMDENRGKYMHPLLSPKGAFQQYTNIVTDFELTLIKKGIQSQRKPYRELIPI
jgi:alpha-amylase